MVMDHSNSERGNPLLPHGLLFPNSSKGSFICIIPQIGWHIPQFGTPIVKHWLEWEIAQWVHHEGRKDMFYLTTHSTHFIYGYMASDIWLRTILIVRKETRCRHIGYSFRSAARVLLYAPYHRQDSTYHGLWSTGWNESGGGGGGGDGDGAERDRLASWLCL